MKPLKLSEKQTTRMMQDMVEKRMSVEDIVKEYYKRNNFSLPLDLFERFIGVTPKMGYKIVRANNTLLFFKPEENSSEVVYHTVSADTPKIYIFSIITLLAVLYQEGYQSAKTYFSDDKTKKFIENYFSNVTTVSPADDPDLGAYMAETNLSEVLERGVG
jgi:hypothetical protein